MSVIPVFVGMAKERLTSDGCPNQAIAAATNTAVSIKLDHRSRRIAGGALEAAAHHPHANKRDDSDPAQRRSDDKCADNDYYNGGAVPRVVLT